MTIDDDILLDRGLMDANLFLLEPMTAHGAKPLSFIPQGKVSSSGWPADWNAQYWEVV